MCTTICHFVGKGGLIHINNSMFFMLACNDGRKAGHNLILMRRNTTKPCGRIGEQERSTSTHSFFSHKTQRKQHQIFESFIFRLHFINISLFSYCREENIHSPGRSTGKKSNMAVPGSDKERKATVPRACSQTHLAAQRVTNAATRDASMWLLHASLGMLGKRRGYSKEI